MSLGNLKPKPKDCKRVIGLDLNSSKMAFAVFDDGKLVKYGEVTFPGKVLFERLISANIILSDIRSHLDADKIVFEQAIFVNNHKTVVSLSYMYGAIVSSLAKHDDVVEAVTPLEWGKAIGNAGVSRQERASFKKANPGKTKSWYDNQFREMRKQITKDWVAKEFDLDTTELSDDICDAISIGWFATR